MSHQKTSSINSNNIRMPDFLVCCVVILFVCCIMWYSIYNLYDLALSKTTQQIKLDNVDHDVDLITDTKKQRNCIGEVHSCLVADDCSHICDTSEHTFVCHAQKFICEPLTLNSTTGVFKDIPAHCDPSKGFLNTISVSELFGAQILPRKRRALATRLSRWRFSSRCRRWLWTVHEV